MDIDFSHIEDENQWIELLNEAKASPFHSPSFMKSFKNEHIDIQKIIIIKNRKIIGGFSGFLNQPERAIFRVGRLFKQFLAYSGPFFKEGYQSGDIGPQIMMFLRKNGYITYSNLGYDMSFKFEGLGENYIERKHDEWIIRLEGSWEDVEGRMKRNFKRKVKKAIENNLDFSLSYDPDHIEILHDLIDETARFRARLIDEEFKKDYFPFMNKEVQKKLLANGIARLALVSKDNQILTALLYLKNRYRGFGIYLGTSEKGYSLGSNSLLDYSNLKDQWKDGGLFYNHGGTGTGPGKGGLIQYKSGLGAIETESWKTSSPLLNVGIWGSLVKLRKKLG